METLLSIFAEIDDPRDHTAQYLLSSMLFIALRPPCVAPRPAPR
jgi:hypothetical protein